MTDTYHYVRGKGWILTPPFGTFTDYDGAVWNIYQRKPSIGEAYTHVYNNALDYLLSDLAGCSTAALNCLYTEEDDHYFFVENPRSDRVLFTLERVQ